MKLNDATTANHWTNKHRRVICVFHMCRCMGKPTICISENKGADQLRSSEAPQHLCFRYTDRTISRPLKSKISSLLPSSVTVQAGLCRNSYCWFFSRTGLSHDVTEMGLVVGVSVGAVCLVLVLIIAFICWRRRRNQSPKHLSPITDKVRH